MAHEGKPSQKSCPLKQEAWYTYQAHITLLSSPIIVIDWFI